MAAYAVAVDGADDPVFLTNVGASDGVTYARGLAFTDKNYTGLQVAYIRQALSGFALSQTVESNVINPQIPTSMELIVGEGGDATFYSHVSGSKGPSYVRAAIIADTDPNTLLNITYARSTLLGFSQSAPTTIDNPKFFTNYDFVYDYGDPVFFNRVKDSTDLQMVRGAAFRRVFAVDNVTGISTTLSATFSTIQQTASVTVQAIGSIDMTLRAFAQTATVSALIMASASQTLFGFSQEADVVTLTAALDQTLPGFTQDAEVSAVIPAAIDQTLFGLTQEADVKLEMVAAADQVLPGLEQAAEAYTLVAAADQTLPGFTQEADATIENPAGSVSGEISLTFQGFSQQAVTEIILPAPVPDEHEGERGRGGGSAPKEIPPHEWEVDLFRAGAYRQNFDRAVPPIAIANVSLGSIQSPPLRPVSVPLAPFVKPR